MFYRFFFLSARIFKFILAVSWILLWWFSITWQLGVMSCLQPGLEEMCLHSIWSSSFLKAFWNLDNSNKMQRYHSNSIRCIFLLLDTHPRAAPLIGWALFWCHWGNQMMGILTHERKCNGWFWLAPPVRLPFRHEWCLQAARAAVGQFTHPSEERGGSARFAFLFFSPPSASVREPSGDQLVTRRPWVSTREYGGWVCAGERGRYGDMPAMVKKKQRDASSSAKCRNSRSLCRFPEAASGFKNCACSSI